MVIVIYIEDIMKNSIKKGLGFGLASGTITTLGLIIGLNSGTGFRSVILGGILVIAVADALSDALGMHISEESEKNAKVRDVWESTISTFFFKFIVALSFIIPVLLLNLHIAIIASIIWGFILLSGFSFYIAKDRGMNPLHAVMEHLVIAVAVIIATNFVGKFVAIIF